MTEAPTGRADRDLWWSIGAIVLGSLMRAMFRLRFVGLEHLPERGGGILASNHISGLDPVVLGLAGARRGRTIRFLGAAEQWRVPVIGWGLRRIRQIPIVRGGHDLAALEIAARVVRAGALAGIYPEGGVGTGELQPARRGAARLALATGGAIIPVAVWGTNARWPRSGLHFRRPWRPVVAVCVGPPITARGDPTSDEALRALTDRMMQGIAEQLARARRIARVP
jgi:1-acyl-sn-glycerol-3-phosphate acyltransferase